MQMDNAVLTLIVIPGVVGLALSAWIIMSLKRADEPLSLRSCAVRFSLPVLLNIVIAVATLGFAAVPSYSLLGGPILIYAYLLSRRVCAMERPGQAAVRALVKAVALVAVWFFAFAPFSLFGLAALLGG